MCIGVVVRGRHNSVSGNAMVEASTINDSVVCVGSVVQSLTTILLFDDVNMVITHHVSMPMSNAMLTTRLFISNAKLPFYIAKSKNGKRNICDTIKIRQQSQPLIHKI